MTNPDMTVSNSRTYTVLSDIEVARGWEAGQFVLSGTPEAIATVPDASYAYVATSAGAEAVVVDLAIPGYLTSTQIQVASGLVDLATTPEGTRVYGVSKSARELIEIDSDPTAGLLFNTVLSTHTLSNAPKGILVDNAGNRAYIPTDAGEIQIWDVKLGSATYQRQVGRLASPGGASVRGKTALTPDGTQLLALTDGGAVLFYDLGPDTLLTTVNVGFDPRDVVVDPFGQRAYVTHAGGLVSVVGGLTSVPFKVQDITTGGSLRGIAVTPAGRFLYAANRQLNQLDVIDLDQNSATLRTVVTNVDQNVKPVDLSISPDGLNAFSVLQGGGIEQPKLVITTIGLGPRIISIAPPAAQPGAIVVVDGQDFGDMEGPMARLYFNGVEATITEYRDNEILARVPTGATTGPVWTTRLTALSPTEFAPLEFSNEVAFEVLAPSPIPPTNIRYAGTVGDPWGDQWNDVIAISPKGDLAWIGTSNGVVIPFDIRPGSPTYHKSLGRLAVYSGDEVSDLAVSPDGKSIFVVSESTTQRPFLVADRSDGQFGKWRGVLPDYGALPGSPKLAAVSPNNRYVVVVDDTSDTGSIYDVTGHADGVVPVYVDSTFWSFGFCTSITFHPSGRAAYLGQANPGRFLIWSTDDQLGSFGQIYAVVNIPVGTPAEGVMDIAFSPDGDSCYVMTSQLSGPDNRSLLRYDTSDPTSPVFMYAEGLNSSSNVMVEHFRLAPQGDRAVYNIRASAIWYVDVSYRPVEHLGAVGVFESLSPSEFAYTPDGTRLYMASTFHDSLRVFDFSSAQTFSIASGDEQAGVVGEVLPAPLRVQISSSSGQSLAGVTVQFEVTTGGGVLGTTSVNPSASQLVRATDANGFAEVWMRMGATPGSQFVQASAAGLIGSPQTFSLWANENPETLPLNLVQVIPLNSTANVSLTTAVQATFSRAVKRTSISSTSLYLHAQGNPTPVPVAYGYTDGDRKVSMTPLMPLAASTVYQVEATAAVEDTSSGPLQNPQTNAFTTRPPPPLAITAISPPSGTVGVPVTVSGTGFDPVASANTVLFSGSVNATATLSTPSSVTATVPVGAVSGPVAVQVGVTTSNSKNFVVLVPTTTTIDDVIGTAQTGAGGKAIAVTPDGAVSYSVSPDGDVVIPVEVNGMVTLPGIAVGDQPVAIDIHPLGSYGYVTNLGSSSLSVIGTDPNSLADYNQVTETLIVGNSPVDVAVMPDGSRVLVVNAGANSISVIDGDSSSATHHSVIASPQTGAGAKAIAVTADGTRIFLGTVDGYVEVSPTSYSVVGTGQTGAGAKAVAVTADGALLIILADNGDLLIVDVDPLSSSYNDVVGTAKTGAGTKAVAVSADGALVYLVQENSDQVIVISLEVLGGVSAVDAPPAQLPPTIVQIAFVDTIPTGSDPAGIAIDPQGSGNFLVTTPGDQSITLYGQAIPTIAADVFVKPRTLLIPVDEDSCDPEDDDWWRQWRGRYIRGWIELPEEYDPHDIDVAAVRLNGVIPATQPWLFPYDDHDNDGILERRVLFDREQFQEIVPQGDSVPVRITGELTSGERFAGDDTIRTLRPLVTQPSADATLHAGTIFNIQWVSPEGVQVDFVDVHYSLNDGRDWSPIAEGIPDNGSVEWLVPHAFSDSVRVMVTIYKDCHKICFAIGAGMSGMFEITMPLATALSSFDLSIEEGAAVMRWRTAVEFGVRGFRVHRSDQSEGIYREVTEELVPAVNRPDGGRYEWRDESVRPNRAYYYKLEEVTDAGVGGVFGPYKVTYRASFELGQNVPNPFNPTTTIKFTIPDKALVRLRVYDVAGRLVRTLVDEERVADFYKVVWDGHDNRGSRVSSGIYFYSLEAGKHRATKKMLLLK
ncbi:MAG: Ig-like domain-containing protein [Candidatus Krumholzibacteria bacterium]|nr:Ig-like domain-containing protein [Candidatus Krumholzibacteria bacterium]